MSINVTGILRRTAAEIREQDINGWGNACDMAIEEIDRLRAELRALAKVTDDLLLGRSIHNSRKPHERIDGPLWDAASAAVAKARAILDATELLK